MVGRRFATLLAVPIALVAHVAIPASASAQATVERFSEPFTAAPVEVDDTCAGDGVVGILTGAGTFAGQQVTTDNGDHFRATITFHTRVDFADGRYLLAEQYEHIGSNANPMVGVVTFGGTLHEKGTLYDAGDTVIGHEMFHARFRTTIVDGDVAVEFDRGFITCR